MHALTTSLSLSNDLLTGTEWNPSQLRDFFHLASDIKARPDRYRSALSGKFLALIFEKPSLRTRVTFEVGIASLGGTAVFLDHTLTHLGERESVRDIAKNLERWVQAIVARVFVQESLEEFAKNANIPVINALSDKYHPCQALADFLTLEERFGNLRGLKFAYIGDGNNIMPHSLLYDRLAGAGSARALAWLNSGPVYRARMRRSLRKRNALRAKLAGKSKSSARPKKP